MAKENVAKFYDKLAQDTALAEKLNALDKAFAEENDASADDMAVREKAAEAIVLPLAKEVGLPFTLEELKEYEHDQLNEMSLSEDELEQVAGGVPKNTKSRNGVNACAYIGVGFGRTKKDGKVAFCIIVGGSNGPVAG
ncbi:hypothetical protein D081_1172 [Anaerovibrio sp. JC8]|uniref:Nif11-like leader peptide family natural product precursor n=1 Tax=Anaerovibrio sp. JC8 TaxID=1240085 RepID=UPI000A0AF419|nr:Nif11-like leader peptide family natural product precursor [Anaerovibrio sp. JC8]ORU00078.1 hypothetical protein D081_1172 [Anaerovibrio sp. JC8]